MIGRLAGRLRAAFDLPQAPTPVLLVAVFGGIATAIGAMVEKSAWLGCRAPIFSLVDLELTFGLRHFRALLAAVPTACRESVIRHFVTWDVAFPIAYPFALAALYLWIERYRRWLPRKPGESQASAITPLQPGPLADWLVVLPFIAALLDLAVENLPLYLAARYEASSALAAPLVIVGSLGAALKFTALALFAMGCIGVLFSGPRGVVLWRVRASAFGALLAGVPLLMIPQGQDILRRLVEGERPIVRVVSAVLVIAATALVTWYAARTLTLVRAESETDPWFAFFERNIPRMVAVALLLVAAMAFAREGRAETAFGGVAAVSYLVAVAMARWRKGWLEALGRVVARGSKAREDDLLPERAGRVIVGILGVVGFWTWSLLTTGPDESEEHLLRSGAALLLAATWILYFAVYFRRDIGVLHRGGSIEELRSLREKWSMALEEGFPIGTVPPFVVWMVLVAGTVSLLLFLLFTFRTVWAARFLGPLVVLAAATANAVVIGSILAYLGRRYRVPFVAIAVILAVVFSFWNDNHAIRTLRSSAGVAPASRAALEEYLNTWLRARAEAVTSDTSRIPLVLVGAAGGGLRAAYWTAVSLATLQDQDTTFASHVFAISGVSGGSVGAAVFAAMRNDLATTVPDCRARLLRQRSRGAVASDSAVVARMGATGACARLYMSGDFLSPVLAKFLAPDFTQWFLPVPIRRFDRGMALEETFERSYVDVMGDTTLQRGIQAFSGVDAVARGVPLLLLNATHVETGRRYLTSPFATDTTTFLDAVDMQRAFNGVDIRLSTAAHNSARFTYVSPAGRIDRVDGKTYGGLVDGGYFENSGLATINELRRAITERLRAPSDTLLTRLARRVQVIVLYLCNDPISCRRDRHADTTLIAASSAVGEWLAPVRALAATREARGRLARATAALEAARRAPDGVAGSFHQLNVCDSLRVAVGGTTDTTDLRTARERIVNPPLGWLMSGRARRWMDASLDASGASAPGSCRAMNAQAMHAIVSRLRATRED